MYIIRIDEATRAYRCSHIYRWSGKWPVLKLAKTGLFGRFFGSKSVKSGHRHRQLSILSLSTMNGLGPVDFSHNFPDTQEAYMDLFSFRWSYKSIEKSLRLVFTGNGFNLPKRKAVNSIFFAPYHFPRLPWWFFCAGLTGIFFFLRILLLITIFND